MNTHVSYPTAILLQEKGMNIWSEYRYTDFNGVERLEKEASEIFPYAPTIADVVMRLYKKHDIWISVEPFMQQQGNCVYVYKIFKDSFIDTISRGSMGYNSPTEAYEAAITYALENLI